MQATSEVPTGADVNTHLGAGAGSPPGRQNCTVNTVHLIAILVSAAVFSGGVICVVLSLTIGDMSAVGPCAIWCNVFIGGLVAASFGAVVGCLVTVRACNRRPYTYPAE